MKIMKTTSTITGVAFKKYLVFFLTILSLSFTQSVLGHSVDSYSGTCASGPQYKVTAVVSNVNNSSNYRWQWKNSSGAWVCFVNGNNTINGNTYNVTGAVYNLTTNPGPIVFTNPNSGLQGLEIRMVISDGNGINPCTLPAGNTWTSTTNHFININNTPCTTGGSIGDKVWFDTNRDGIQDAGENGIKGVTVKLRNASNTVIATDITDVNGNYLFSGLSAGTYTVEFPVTVYGYILSPAYVGTNRNIDSDPAGSTGLTPTITLAAGQSIVSVDAGYAPDCSCTNSSSNLLINGSFENGTTGWNWSSANGSLTTGTGYVACGNKNGFNNQSSGTSTVWQDVTVAPGAIVTFSAYAGTHTGGIGCSPKLSLIFLNAANAVIGQTNVTVTRDVDINNSQLEQYIITATAPAGTAKARVQSSITCNTMKLDAFCLTVSSSCVGGGTWNLNMPNGTLGTSQTYTVNGVTITAYGFNNGNPGTPTALYGKNDGGDETGLGINSNVNHEIDINHFVQLDLNQVIAAGATSGTMSIGSMQAGEPANVYGSNTLGVIGTLLMTVPVTLDNTPFAIPGFPTYRYISVRASAASPADVLLQQVSFSCPSSLVSIGDRVWYDTNNNGINDASENGIRGVTVNLYKDNNNDNVADGASIATSTTDVNGNYTFSNLAPGNYIVGAVIPKGYMSSSINGGDPDNNIDLDDNGQVSAGNEVRGLAITVTAGGEPGGNTNNTYDFGMLPDCACTNSPSNLLTNASFENGTTGWSWSAPNGSLTTGTGYVACGLKNGFNNQSSGTSKVWQDVTVSAGATVIFSGFAGTHTPGINCSPKLSLIFLNAANAVISQTDVTVTRDVDINNGQLEQYSITAFAPSGTVKARVQSSITCNTMKLDAFCLRASSGGALPINISDFTATKNNCTANLNWKTSSEINSDKFEVEVSTNNNAVYTTAGTVMAAGSSSTTRSYQYSYVMQPGVTYFFRVKMVDRDGSFKYSDIRSLNCTGVKGIVIAPNPVLTHFTITGMENGKNNVAIYDASGQLIKAQVIAQSQGEVNISNLHPGFYTVKITGETGNTAINKIVKY
jgi:hypothetical protein